MDCVVTPLKTLMGFSVHLNVQLKFYNLPYPKLIQLFDKIFLPMGNLISNTRTVRITEKTLSLKDIKRLFEFLNIVVTS